MKRICIILLILIYTSSVFLVPADAQEEVVKMSVSQGCHSLDAQNPVLGSDQLITNAKSVVLYEASTDTLMHAYNADERLDPASFAKVLTALVALEEGDLAAKVTVREAVLSAIPKSAVKTGFFDGEVLTLENLLYCMIVDSGNDAAALIAEHIGGSQDGFAAKMNAYAQRIGCLDSNFMNAHGLSDSQQYTTARDMGRIMKAAVENEALYEILGTIYYTVPATPFSTERNLVSENFLINDDETEIYFDGRVTASRTGTAGDGSRCIASVAEQNGLFLISIIMGAESSYDENGVKIKSFGGFPETTALLNIGFDDLQPCQLVYQGQVLVQKPVINGDSNVSLGTKEPAATVLPVGVTMDLITVEFSFHDQQLSAPLAEGDHVAVARYLYDGRCIAEVDIYAFNAVKTVEDSIVIKKTENKEDGTSIILVLILLIVIVIIGYVFIRRKFIRPKRRPANKQRKKVVAYDELGRIK